MHSAKPAIALLSVLLSAPAQAQQQAQAQPKAQSKTLALGQGAEQFAGTSVAVDDRLRARTCAAPGGYSFAWAGPDARAVEARCAANFERLVLPLLARDAEATRLKRGDSVQAEALGQGFRLSVAAVAENAGRDGSVILRNSRSGQRFAARLDPSGRIIVSNREN